MIGSLKYTPFFSLLFSIILLFILLSLEKKKKRVLTGQTHLKTGGLSHSVLRLNHYCSLEAPPISEQYWPFTQQMGPNLKEPIPTLLLTLHVRRMCSISGKNASGISPSTWNTMSRYLCALLCPEMAWTNSWKDI